MRTRRLSTHRTVVVLTTVVVMAIGLVASGIQASSSPKETSPPSLNRMEHQAHQALAEAQQEQARILNQREHQAHQALAEAQQEQARAFDHEHQAHRGVKRVVPASRTVVPPARRNQCALMLERAWRDRRHFSDAYDTYLLRQPPCSSVVVAGRTRRP
jgi:hypothetical protein